MRCSRHGSVLKVIDELADIEFAPRVPPAPLILSPEELMISLTDYLEAKTDPTGSRNLSQQDLLLAVLDAYSSALVDMGHCSMDICPGIGNELKKKLDSLRAELSTDVSLRTLSEIGTRVRLELETWGRETARHYQQRANEVKGILLTMAQTAESVGASDDRAAGHISEVTERLKAIGSLDDIIQIRASIEKSAEELKVSIDRMAAEGKAALDQLKEQVTHYQSKLEEAEEVASRDALTTLSNRLYVENQIEMRIQTEIPFCVAIIDIDRFKKVNDDYGHLTGDELLKQFSNELRNACRATDIVGRWGGDEFIVLFDCGPAEAQMLAERLFKRTCRVYTVQSVLGEIQLQVGASIGLAAHTRGEAMKDLLERADSAMYSVKASNHAARTS